MSNHYYGNILYDGKKDNYHYIGFQRHEELVCHLYTGETFGYTISDKTIKDIVEGELEKMVKEK